MKDNGRKFLVVSHIIPPFQSGQANVLYQLLKDIDNKRFALVTLKNRKLEERGKIGLSKLDCSHYYMNNVRLPYRLGFLKTPFLPIINITMRMRGIRDAAVKEGARAIIVCSGDLYNIPAAYLAARSLDVPLVIYMFDDYVYQWTGLNRVFSRNVFKRISKKVRGIIAPNEYLQREYKENYGVESTVIHNPCHVADLDELDVEESPYDGNYINIAYTGSIYGAHYDAFRNLVDALKLLKENRIRLNLFTSTSRTELEKHGISGDMLVFHKYLNQKDIPLVLRKADILFLPLAFKSDYPEVIKTSAPGKTGEYLSAGRPILVHAPGDSFISSYFRENKCGVVADREETSHIADCILSIVKDGEIKAEMGKMAVNCAVRDFEISRIQSKFNSYVDDILD